MSTEKKLISFNTEKHPEVARFFSELEDTNLASHYVREAIKFYQQYKNQVTTTINVPTVQVEPIAQPVGHTKPLVETTSDEPVQVPKDYKKQQTDPGDNKNKFVEFNPNNIFG